MAAYAVPARTLLPKSHRPGPRRLIRSRLSGGATVTVLSTSVAVMVLAAALAVPQTGPQVFDIVATAAPVSASAPSGITVTMTATLDRYTPEHDRVKVTDG